jgi:hypothetical protein
MAWSFPDTPDAISAPDGSDPTGSLSASLIDGDAVLVIGGHPRGTAGTFPNPIGPVSGSGYTELFNQMSATGSSSDVHVGVWVKFMGATPDTTITCEGTGTSTSDAAAYAIHYIRGANPSDFLAAAITYTAAVGAVDPPSITPDVAGALIIACTAVPNNDGTATPPTGYTIWGGANQTDTRAFSVHTARKELVSATAEDPDAFTSVNVGTATALAFTLALAPATSNAPVTINAPAGNATATAPTPNVLGGSAAAGNVSAPAANATASAPSGTVETQVTIYPPVANASASASVPSTEGGTGGDHVAISAPAAVATATVLVPVLTAAITIPVPSGTATATSPTPQHIGPATPGAVTVPAGTATATAVAPSVVALVSLRYSPPTHEEAIRSEERILRYFRMTTAMSVVRVNGVFTQIRMPSPELLEGLVNGVDYFRGGYIYPVTEDQLEELSEAGFPSSV